MKDKKWYSGKYDRTFKEVMLYEKNRDLLKMVLEKILSVTIENLEVLNVEKVTGNIHVKGKRLDLNLKTNIGKINVEVNSYDEDYVHSKNFSYFADTYSHDALVGDNFDDGTMYIQINLSYGLKKKSKAIRKYKMRDEEGNTYIDNFLLYDLNMDYYSSMWYTKTNEKDDDDIILVMLGLERDELLALSKKNKVVERYMNEVYRVNEDPEFREYMSYEEEQRKIRNSLILNAEKKGLERGKSEVIMKLLNSGMTIEEISKITEIPIEKITKIRDTE